MHRGVVLLALTCACGKIGFDRVPGDAAQDDAPLAVCADHLSGVVPPSGIVTGRLDGETADVTGSCGGGGIAEAMYAIDVPAGASLLVATDLAGTLANTLIHVRRDCADPATEVACDLDGGIDVQAAYRVSDPGAGRYYVFIEREQGAAVEYEASIQVLLPEGAACTPGPGREICGPDLGCVAGVCSLHSCSTVFVINIATLGTQPVMLSTAGSIGDHAGTCGEGNDGGVRARDQTVQINLMVPARLEISSENPGTDYDSLLYLREGCTGPELGCSDDVSASSYYSRFMTAQLTPGTYYLFVDGFSTRSGFADITIRAF